MCSWMAISHARSATALICITAAMCCSHIGHANDRNADQGPDAVEVTRLIEQLGSDQFATREKAQSTIQGMGLAVFDALLEAQYHPDIEVARRARYLLRGMPVQWAEDDDPQEVQSTLRDYGQQGRDERVSRIERLAGLNSSLGVEALCRIMRFESDALLSKRAALQLMWHKESEDVADRNLVSNRILTAVDNSRRPAAQWLRTYAKTLVTPEASLDAWEELTRAELATMIKTPEKTQRSVVRDLLRWHVDLLRRMDRMEQSRTNIMRIVELVEPDRKELFDVVDWALEREAWFVPEELAERFPIEYWQDDLLVYRLAEAQQGGGNEQAAEETVQRALAMHPNQNLFHARAAHELYRKRMMFDWAKREFQLAIKTAAGSPEREVMYRAMLADMLTDLEEEREAAEVLEGTFALAKKNPTAIKQYYGPGYSQPEVRAQIDRLLGLHYGREGEIDKQKSHLQKALAVDVENIDIVIALHRVSDDSHAWKKYAEELLAKHVRRIEIVLSQQEQLVDAGNVEAVEALAQKNNEYAWLVSNTAGDFQRALKCSHKSLELIPDSWSYQDTLGRCYYAAGDLENAIHYQQLAIAQAPHLQQMRRQLKLFEDAVAESQTK